VSDEDIPADWYPDPDDGGVSQRYWNGSQWTEETRSPWPPPRSLKAAPRGSLGGPSGERPERPAFAPPGWGGPPTGSGLPPSQPPHYGPLPPGPSGWTTWRILALGAVALVVALVAIGSIVSSPNSQSTAPAAQTTSATPRRSTSGVFQHPADAQITECSNQGSDFADAKVVVTNRSSKPSNYAITVLFESKDGNQQVGTGNVFVNELQPGQASVPLDASSFQSAPEGSYVCRLGDVSRYASN
jgi:hypothetical protein